jgi:hypothetical protein
MVWERNWSCEDGKGGEAVGSSCPRSAAAEEAKARWMLAFAAAL